MSSFSIEIWTKKSLLPVTKEELISSTYSLLETLRILSDSSRGLCECGISCREVEWSATEEEMKLVQSSTPWSYLLPMWLYAEQGELTSLPKGVHLDDAVADLVKWLCAIESISEHSGEYTYTPILKVIIKFFARLKLDFNIELDVGGEVPLFHDIENGCMSIEEGWLPQVHCKYLSVVEVALLAGVSNIRTVRNAQYDKENPLHFFKEDKKVLVTTDTANKWLSLRRGYVVTKNTINKKKILH